MMADDTGRIPGHDGFGRNVADNHAAGGDNRVRSNGHSRSDESPRRHPCAFRDVDGRDDQVEIRGAEVVRGGTQIGVLGNDRSRPQLNPADAIAIDVVSQAAPLLHDQIPWRPHPGARIRPGAAGDRSSEATQQEAAPSVEDCRRRAIERPAEIPKRSAGFVFPGK